MNMATKTEVIRVRVTRENAANIRALAKAQQRPFANAINVILSDYFTNKGVK
jgi:hypothetical protein